MSWLLPTLGFVLWFAVFLGLSAAAGWALVEHDSVPAAAGIGLVAMFALIGPAVYLTQHEDDKGPCLRYETGTQVVMVGKVPVTQQYRYCAERGEWIESGR